MVLPEGSSVDDYRTFTAVEKAAAEKVATEWVRPPQMFIDQFNEAAGSYGSFNEASGYFELNGLTDITYPEAIGILKYASVCGSNIYKLNQFYSVEVRTLLPVMLRAWVSQTLEGFCLNASNLEAVVLLTNNSYITTMSMTFYNCSKLKRVEGMIILWTGFPAEQQIFIGCKSLEEFRLHRLTKSINIKDCKMASYESILCLLSKSTNTQEITITVHPDIYAKITDESNEQWHALLELAESKNILFATV